MIMPTKEGLFVTMLLLWACCAAQKDLAERQWILYMDNAVVKDVTDTYKAITFIRCAELATNDGRAEALSYNDVKQTCRIHPNNNTVLPEQGFKLYFPDD